MINRARLNPQAEADRLLGGNLNEGITVEAQKITTTPKQPLVFNAKLYQAARLHSQDMIAHDYFSHNSQDGRNPWQRMQAQGYSYYSAAENIYIDFSVSPPNEVNTITAMHDGFVVDSGIAERGHRKNIFNASLKEIGIGSAFGGYVYGGYNYSSTWALTCDFGARSGNSFVLGVVYDDANANGFYSAGEGLAGVNITALRTSDEETASTLTATAGGYGIPLPAGTYEVTATLNDGRVQTKTATISNQNVKIDFREKDFHYLHHCGAQGDVDGNGVVDLKDAVIALQILTGQETSVAPCVEASVSGGKIGLAEVFFVLRSETGM